MASAAAAVRDLGFIKWRDPRAWMESMRGPRWRALVRAENERFDTAVAAAAGPRAEHLRSAALSFEAARLEAEAAGAWTWEVAGRRLQLRPQPGGSILWSAEDIGGGKATVAPAATLSGDLDVEEDILVHTVDAGHGAEKYRLIALRSQGKVAWSSNGQGGRGFGPPVAALAGRVYCLEATGPLQYQRLVSFDLRTGSNRRVEYEETNPSVMLELVRGAAGCLFLVTDLAGRRRLYHVVPAGGVKRLTHSGETAVHPVGYCGANDEPCYLVRSRSRRGHWIARGSPAFKSFWASTLPAKLLRSEEFGIDAVLLDEKGMIVVREHGLRTAWVGRRQVAEWFGEFEVNPWLFWKGGEHVAFIVHRPGSLPSRDWAKPVSYAPNTASGFAKNSIDGAQVRWFVCWAGGDRKPKGLIATVYGAYGLPTRLMTSRWKPYLERGMAIGFAFVRGGGDHTESWAAAGQVAGKALGIADFEAAVGAMQKATGVAAGATVAFGRSAGGYIVGNSVAARPGLIAAAAYMEVPYVDVLRTSSNPTLPLTQYEYEEFGNPATGPVEFETVMRLSPVDVAAGAGTGTYDDVFVLCRTFDNDKNVLAYESLKWIDALRSGAERRPKLVAVRKGQGHFSFGVAASLQRAEDFVLIMENLEKK